MIKLIFLGLNKPSQDVLCPVCHYLSHASPNLDGNVPSFVSVGSERHLRIPVYIFLSQFIFMETWYTIVPITELFLCHQEKHLCFQGKGMVI